MNYAIDFLYKKIQDHTEYLGTFPTNSQMALILPITEREIAILRARYNPDGTYKQTLTDVANLFKLTHQRVRQINDRSFGILLQRKLEEDEI
jgi:DNA-directed RNA polymerase sigma subunit (sigma70/sigma32)